MGWLVFLVCFVLLDSQFLIYPSTPLPSQLCHPDERSALLKFSNSLSLNPEYLDIAHLKTVSWKNGTDCCSWDGVLCDPISGHVIGLNMSFSFLQGSLHSNSTLFSLRHLQSLILDDINFNGSPIPSDFSSLANLKRLSLGNTNFSGNVPVELSHLSKLSHLVFSSTNSIFLETYVLKRMLQNFTDLRELTLNRVDMSDVPLDSSFTNVSISLMFLDLSHCELQGNFPDFLLRLPNLHHLDLWNNNNLTGSLPTFNWTSPLRYLSLSYTRISVDLPYLCNSAKSLQALFLRNCSFRGAPYPTRLANLSQLVQLDTLFLDYNNFGGQIPLFSFNLQHLIKLDLSGNNFVGKIPENLEINSTQSPFPMQLEVLVLSDNLLSGSIPSWMYSLPFLKSLNLNRNKIIGPIKEFKSRFLESLQLGTNKLHSLIPSSIFLQENLRILYLSTNNLYGVLELNKFSMLRNLENLDLSYYNFTLSSNNYDGNNLFPRLQYLSLASCNIVAFPYFLKSLKKLKRIDLSHNQIHGSIPQWLWNQGTTSLSHLNISYNFLTHVEQIPFQNLKYLDLRSNMIQGNLPIVPPSLIVFFISNNHLSGEIPSTYCTLSKIYILDFSNNSIHGKIPSCLGNKSFLSVLDLDMNNFSGEISRDMFENSTSLRSLHLSGNQLEGSLPRSLWNCKNLEVLDVGKNKINDTFPHWLEDLPMLQVLVLNSNKFHGSIGTPKVKSPFNKLKIMDLSNNEFSGLLPTKYFESFTATMDGHAIGNMTRIGDHYYQDSVIVVMKGSERSLEKIISIFITIDFSINHFEGEIPESIGKLKALKGLNFSQNKLKGSIPMSLTYLSNLEWLDLSSNELVGTIPNELPNLTQLSTLNLSHNKLVGPIPSGNQFDTFNNDSYSGNLELCGFPLSKSCNNGEMQQEGDHGEKHEDHGIFNWNIVKIGYGCGMIIGIFFGYIMLFNTRLDSWLRKKIGRGAGQRQGQRTKIGRRGVGSE
ncbi:receptor-like protein 7 [Humulus lupulus]|uniref:receptor-like protein 7 n=1 Tax=Humulus lupulus TaxID=3486 RepID=UPI002B401C0F|nr:receptor-like protein 7 [Humulus lupulus]